MNEEPRKDVILAAVMEAVEKQILDEDPAETKQTLERLVTEGFSEEASLKLIGQAACVEIWSTMQGGRYDEERYIRNLKDLPKEPEE